MGRTMLDDRILIWQFNRGRGRAAHRIYERYKHDLVTLAASLLTDLSLAEDVVHDVFIGFLGSAGRFRLTGSLKGYLCTCVANAARNCNKSERRRRHESLDARRPCAGQGSQPESRVRRNEEFLRLAHALERLPYEQREALVLRVYGGMTFPAVAAQQGVSVSTAKGRFRYALDKMRSLMGPPEPDDRDAVSQGLGVVSREVTS
jgi:RNA polymerase sigma-70 factor (ECF subfamily)